MARSYTLSLLSTNRVVRATTVDATPDRTKMGDRKPNPGLAKAHNHGTEAQSETSLSTIIATDANTARRVLPDSPADDRYRGGEHTKVGYESSHVSCPFACQQEVTGNLQDGQAAALVEGLWLNRETAGPVAVPGSGFISPHYNSPQLHFTPQHFTPLHFTPQHFTPGTFHPK